MRRTAAEFIGSRYQSSFDEHRRRQVPETWNALDAMNDEVTIRTVRGLDGLREIRNSWAAIAQGLGDREHFFHQPEWYQSYLETLEKNPDAVVFQVVS